MRLPDPRHAAATLAAAALAGLAPGTAARETTAPVTYTFAINAVEFKGSTTLDKLTPPPASPAQLSKGYAYKGPGEADTSAPERWEVSSYAFSPSFVTVHQGDTVNLRVFVIHGDLHETHVKGPDGQLVVGRANWNRGREYQASFVAEKAGVYELVCSTHAPTMSTKILVLPR